MDLPLTGAGRDEGLAAWWAPLVCLPAADGRLRSVRLTRTGSALPPSDAVILTAPRQRSVNPEKPSGHRRCPIWWGEAPPNVGGHGLWTGRPRAPGAVPDNGSAPSVNAG